VNDTFYFDFISPYAYIGWHVAQSLATKHGRQLVPVPVLFAALLNHHGTKGPAEVPAKRLYVFKDTTRLARAHGLPLLVPPPTHPFSPLLALRIVSMVDDMAVRARAVSALFAATWAGNGGVEDAANVERVLSAAGFDAASLLRAASTDGAKTRLRQQTEAAIGNGVFGVPTLVVDGEIFWGVDSLAHAEQRMLGFDAVNEVDLLRWADLPSSASRR
jgi:2-hydroxychromene-2-carboxylate isomerase